MFATSLYTIIGPTTCDAALFEVTAPPSGENKLDTDLVAKLLHDFNKVTNLLQLIMMSSGLMRRFSMPILG